MDQIISKGSDRSGSSEAITDLRHYMDSFHTNTLSLCTNHKQSCDSPRHKQTTHSNIFPPCCSRSSLTSQELCETEDLNPTSQREMSKTKQTLEDASSVWGYFREIGKVENWSCSTWKHSGGESTVWVCWFPASPKCFLRKLLIYISN